MVNENRAHAYDGMDRAGHTTSTPEGPRDGGSLTIGELARDAGVTLRALRFYQSKGACWRHGGTVLLDSSAMTIASASP